MSKILLYLIFMINPTTLVNNLTGLVGFEQPTNPEYQILDSVNTSSRSGLYVTDNPFVKVESIKDSQDYAEICDKDFNDYLRKKLGTAAIDVANMVFSENDFIDRQMYYKHALNKISQFPVSPPATNAQGNNANVYTLPAGFNCYWIQVKQDADVAFNIKRVGLEFNGTGSIVLYLFNTADLTTPLYKQTIDITKPFQEVALLDNNGIANGWICDNSAFGKGYKGDYYLGYFTEDAAGLQPFARLYREAIIGSVFADNCITWYRANFAKFINLTAPFDLVGYTPYAQYNGINPDIIVYQDYTDSITQNERLFARAIQLKAQIGLMTETLASIRANKNKRYSEANIRDMMIQLEGASGDGVVKVTGLKQYFAGAIKSLQKEMNKLKQGYTGEGLITVQTLG